MDPMGYIYNIKISIGGIPNRRNVLFLQIFLKRAAKPRAGNTSANFPWIKWPQILLKLTWLCTKASQTFSGTFFGTLLNLTWLCTKASETSSEPCWTWPGFAPKPPRPSPEPSPEPGWTWPGCTKASPTFSRNLLPNLLRNPVEPDLACTKTSQTFSGTFSGTLLNLSWLCTKASQTFSRNLLPNLLRNPVEPDPAPAPVHTGAILGWRPR